jgi:serine protease Do
LQKAEKALAQQEVVLDRAAAKLDEAEDKLGDLGMMGEEGSWLGVKMQEVTAENVKELKLPAERGVLVREVVPESPAAKAGLKANDVITELDGQRVEGTAQFHRMIHETPAGRTVHLTVWRDGKAQAISAVLGKPKEHARVWVHPGPEGEASGEFLFRMPKIPPMPEFGGNAFFFTGPRLGIDAEDLDGQLGNYFGAPDGEGILVREVKSGSPAEKAGLKAGDVIIKLDGARIRSVGELREKLAEKHDQKSVTLGVLRDRAEISVTVEPEQPRPSKPRAITGLDTHI